jgi:hypothetical protein
MKRIEWARLLAYVTGLVNQQTEDKAHAQRQAGKGTRTEKPNRYCVVNGNVWQELITEPTVMRPMVSDIVTLLGDQPRFKCVPD